MAEEEDKPGQDATIQVSGSELEVLRQSAQMIAVSRDALSVHQDHHPKDETTLDLELTGESPAPAKDDDSTKAINRQSLVQIIKTEINASNPSGEAKPFGIMRRDERGAPALLKRPSKEYIRELGDEHSDQTQAIGKEELKLLRQSQNIALDEISQAAPPQAQDESSESSEQALDEMALLERDELEDELTDEQDEQSEQDELKPEAPTPNQAHALEDAHEAALEQAPSRAPWMLLVALLLFVLGALLLIGLDVISV